MTEDGDTDDDESVMTRWSDETKTEIRSSSPGIHLKFDAQAVKDYYNSANGSDRPLRSSRQKAVRYSEESFFERPAPAPMNNKAFLQIGAPDGTYIKALGMVCTEVLRKIEEDDLPPAVTFQEWPPTIDQHFVPVQFIQQQQQPILDYTGVPVTFSAPVIAAPLVEEGQFVIRQPVPVQRIVPQTILDGHDEEDGEMIGSHTPSSSPLDTESSTLSRLNHDIMTPPETPVSLEAVKPGAIFAPTDQQPAEKHS